MFSKTSLAKSQSRKSHSLSNQKIIHVKKSIVTLIMSFLSFLFLSGMIAGYMQDNYNIYPPVTMAVALVSIVVLSVYKMARPSNTSDIVRCDVQVEMWVDYIIKRWWKDSMFVRHAFSEDQYVVGGRIVHIPQPGAKPLIVKNRNSFPAAAVRRTDTDILYALDEYTTDPTHIQDAEKVEVSYEKIDSVLGDHSGALNETVADDMIWKWSNDIVGASVIETSGATTSAKVSGQTGNRLAMVHGDLKKARLTLNLQKAPGTDRFALLEENMLDEMVDSLSSTQYKDFSQYYDASTGVIGKLYGFNIMSRATVAMSAAALSSGKLVVNPLGTATSATDQVTSLCWQKDAVTRAIGDVKFFEKINDPQYYGDVYSALVRMGGRRRRADDSGVIVLRQKTA
jgi:hypothetical protein